jgi:hypothetical protein
LLSVLSVCNNACVTFWLARSISWVRLTAFSRSAADSFCSSVSIIVSRRVVTSWLSAASWPDGTGPADGVRKKYPAAMPTTSTATVNARRGHNQVQVKAFGAVGRWLRFSSASMW